MGVSPSPFLLSKCHCRPQEVAGSASGLPIHHVRTPAACLLRRAPIWGLTAKRNRRALESAQHSAPPWTPAAHKMKRTNTIVGTKDPASAMEESKPTIRRVMWCRRFLASTIVVPPDVAEHLNTDFEMKLGRPESAPYRSHKSPSAPTSAEPRRVPPFGSRSVSGEGHSCATKQNREGLQ